MASTGLLQVHAYTSRASLPVSGATVTVRDPEGRLLAVRETNSSGLIDPVTVQVPDRSESRDPNFVGQPFTRVMLSVRHPSYAQIDVQNAQVFSGVVTVQNLDMIPLSQLPGQFNPTEEFNIPRQNL